MKRTHPAQPTSPVGLTLLEVILALAILAVSFLILWTTVSLGLRARQQALSAQQIQQHVSGLFDDLIAGRRALNARPEPLPETRWTWSATLQPLPEDESMQELTLLFTQPGGHQELQFRRLIRATQLATVRSTSSGARP